MADNLLDVAQSPQELPSILPNVPEMGQSLEVVEEEVDIPLLKYLEESNIVEELKDAKKTASDILLSYGDAFNSMKEWKKKYDEALQLAKLEPKAKKKTFPFDGASTAMLPYILESMLDFNARSAPELAFAKRIVSARIFGAKNDEKDARAKRVETYSNYQLIELMPSWQDEQDKNLMALPCVGTTYKKTYYDFDKKEVVSDLCLADEIVFDQSYRTFDLAPDKYEKTTYTKNELIGLIRGDQQWVIEEDKIDDEDDETFIEAYTWIDLDEDGLEEPYLVIVWERNAQAVYMRPLYDEDTITLADDEKIIKVEMVKIFTQYRFMPDPEGGPMGMGWGILLGSMFKALNTSLRQQLDAGTLAVTASNSGLINADTTSKRGNSVQSGPIKIKMGQLTPIHTRGTGNLSQNVAQFPFSGPNPTMFQLLDYLSSAARTIVNTSVEIESNAGEASSLYLARLQQGLKRPNVIIMRVYKAAQFEFNKIFELNGKHHSNEKYNRVLDEGQEYSMRMDFNADDCDIRLVADPQKGSDIERAARADAILQEAKTQPSQVLNLRQAYLDWLEVMQLPQEEIELLAPKPPEQDPMQQMLLAQQQMEAEFRNREMKTREQRLQLDQMRAAIDASKEISKLGIEADKTEAEITKLYSEALKNIVDSGVAAGQDAIQTVQRIEDRFINSAPGGGNGTSAARPNPGDPRRNRNLAAPPGNQGIPSLPPAL